MTERIDESQAIFVPSLARLRPGEHTLPVYIEGGDAGAVDIARTLTHESNERLNVTVAGTEEANYALSGRRVTIARESGLLLTIFDPNEEPRAAHETGYAFADPVAQLELHSPNRSQWYPNVNTPNKRVMTLFMRIVGFNSVATPQCPIVL